MKVNALQHLILILVRFHASLICGDAKESVGEPLATIWFCVAQQIIGKQTV